MKVKELISYLQKCDPEAHVNSSGDGPIYYVDQLPGYYDGDYGILLTDPKKDPFYSIIGYEFSRKGTKVILKTMNLEDCLLNTENKEELTAFEIKTSDPEKLKQAEAMKVRISKIYFTEEK